MVVYSIDGAAKMYPHLMGFYKRMEYWNENRPVYTALRNKNYILYYYDPRWCLGELTPCTGSKETKKCDIGTVIISY